MKIQTLRTLSIILAAIVVVVSCKKDDDKKTSAFVGNYSISEAKLTSDLVIPTNEAGDYTLASGTDITAAIQQALLNAVTCGSASDSWVELRADNSMYLSCMGANAVNAGTWLELSATSLQLNMNATAIPPVGFSLTVSDVVIDASNLSGSTIIPMSTALISALIAPMTLTEDAPPVFVMNISIKFQKK